MYGCVVIWVNRPLTWAFFLSKASQLRLRHSTHINITWFMSHGESKFLALPKWVQLIHWEAWRLWCFSKRLDLWWYVGVWNPLWILTCMLLVETANITWLQRVMYWRHADCRHWHASLWKKDQVTPLDSSSEIEHDIASILILNIWFNSNENSISKQITLIVKTCHHHISNKALLALASASRDNTLQISG